MDQVAQVRKKNIVELHRLIVAVEQAKNTDAVVDSQKCWEAARKWEDVRFRRCNALTEEYYNTVREKLELLKSLYRKEATSGQPRAMVPQQQSQHRSNHAQVTQQTHQQQQQPGTQQGYDHGQRQAMNYSPYAQSPMHQQHQHHSVPAASQSQHQQVQHNHQPGRYNHGTAEPYGQGQPSHSQIPSHHDLGRARPPQQVTQRREIMPIPADPISRQGQGQIQPREQHYGREPTPSQHHQYDHQYSPRHTPVNNDYSQGQMQQPSSAIHQPSARSPHQPSMQSQYGRQPQAQMHQHQRPQQYEPTSHYSNGVYQQSQVSPPHRSVDHHSQSPAQNHRYQMGYDDRSSNDNHNTMPPNPSRHVTHSPNLAPQNHMPLQSRPIQPSLSQHQQQQVQQRMTAHPEQMERKFEEKYREVKQQMQRSTIERILFLRSFFSDKAKAPNAPSEQTRKCGQFLTFLDESERVIRDDNLPREGYKNGLLRLQKMYTTIKTTETKIRERIRGSQSQTHSQVVNSTSSTSYPPRQQSAQPPPAMPEIQQRTANQYTHPRSIPPRQDFGYNHTSAQISPKPAPLQPQPYQVDRQPREIPVAPAVNVNSVSNVPQTKQPTRKPSTSRNTPAVARQIIRETKSNVPSVLGKRTSADISTTPMVAAVEPKRVKPETSPLMPARAQPAAPNVQANLAQNTKKVEESLTIQKSGTKTSYPSPNGTKKEPPQSNQMTPPITSQKDDVKVNGEVTPEVDLSTFLKEESSLAKFFNDRVAQRPEDRKPLDWGNARKMVEPVLADFNNLF